MKIIKALAVAATLLTTHAMAAAPWLHVRETVTIDAPAGKVWKAVKDFNALNTWHPALAKDDIVEGSNNTVGAVRLLTLKDGGTIKEKLLAFSEAGQRTRELRTPFDGESPVVWAGEGRLLTAFSDSTVVLRDARSGKILRTFAP